MGRPDWDIAQDEFGVKGADFIGVIGKLLPHAAQDQFNGMDRGQSETRVAVAGSISKLSFWLECRRALPQRESGIIALCGLALPGVRLTMPCFLLLVILLFPRVALVLMWIYSTYLQRAFQDGLALPVLGFIFLPLTTIVYAWELNSGMPTAGVNLLWLLVAVIIDLGGLGGGAHRQSRR